MDLGNQVYRLPTLAAVATLLGVCAAVARAQCLYDATPIQGPIDPVLGAPVTIGMGLNADGHVVGYYYYLGPESSEAFWWAPESGLTTLPRPPGVITSRAIDISSSGVVVGTYTVSSGIRGYVYNQGEFTELMPLPGGAWSSASAISNNGVVVGSRSIAEGVNPMNAFTWSSDGGFIDLGLMDSPETAGADISELGHVVGRRGLPASNEEVFLWDGSAIALLGPVPGGVSSTAGGINNADEICGAGLIEPYPGVSTWRSFIWHQGSFEMLGTLPEYDGNTARGINDFSQVVGNLIATGDPTDNHAFLWQLGEIYDLNDLLAPNGTKTLWRAHAINNRGQIIANGIDGAGAVVAFCLTPIGWTHGDLDLDCRVGIVDFLQLLGSWGPCDPELPCPADLNDSGNVDGGDLLVLLLHWS